MGSYRPHSIVEHDHLINLYYLNVLNFNCFSVEKIHFLTLLSNFVFFHEVNKPSTVIVLQKISTSSYLPTYLTNILEPH